MKQWIKEMPIYEIWTMDKSNYTVLGFIVLYIPLLLLGVINTIVMNVFAILLVMLLGPFILMSEGMEKLDKRYNLSAKINTGLCKVGTGFKLIKRC